MQFGQAYGISNSKGIPSESEIEAILETALANGVDMLDTAPAYGASETILGRLLNISKEFCIVTKTVPLNNNIDNQSPRDSILRAFEQSLARLQTDHVYGLMIHLAEDLLGESGDVVWRTLEEIQTSASAKLIGTSCYTGSELTTILSRYPISLVQAPFNIFDQNLLHKGLLADLSAGNVEFHARSIFLQGLAFMSPENLPAGFSSAQEPLKLFRTAAKKVHLTPLELALRFVASVSEVDRMVVGVTDRIELQEIISALDSSLPRSIDTAALAVSDLNVVTPSRWPPDQSTSWDFDFSPPNNPE